MAQAELRGRQRKTTESPEKYDVVGDEMDRHRKRRKRGREEMVEDVEEKKEEEEEEEEGGSAKGPIGGIWYGHNVKDTE
jgi:hypothetical protein